MRVFLLVEIFWTGQLTFLWCDLVEFLSIKWVQKSFLCPDTGPHSRLIPLVENPSWVSFFIHEINQKYWLCSLYLNLLIYIMKVNLSHFGIIFFSPTMVIPLWILFFFYSTPFILTSCQDTIKNLIHFYFQSIFNLPISVFVVLTGSVSLYVFWCILHTLHGKWYKCNPCCFGTGKGFHRSSCYRNVALTNEQF